MTEAGLILKWTQDEILKLKSNTEEEDDSSEKGPGALTLEHLQSAFFLLFIGFTSAFVAGLIELFYFFFIDSTVDNHSSKK